MKMCSSYIPAIRQVLSVYTILDNKRIVAHLCRFIVTTVAPHPCMCWNTLLPLQNWTGLKQNWWQEQGVPLHIVHIIHAFQSLVLIRYFQVEQVILNVSPQQPSLEILRHSQGKWVKLWVSRMGMSRKTSKERHPGDIWIRCLNPLNWLLLTWRSSSSILSQPQPILWGWSQSVYGAKLISATCIHDLVLLVTTENLRHSPNPPPPPGIGITSGAL